MIRYGHCVFGILERAIWLAMRNSRSTICLPHRTKGSSWAVGLALPKSWLSTLWSGGTRVYFEFAYDHFSNLTTSVLSVCCDPSNRLQDSTGLRPMKGNAPLQTAFLQRRLRRVLRRRQRCRGQSMTITIATPRFFVASCERAIVPSPLALRALPAELVTSREPNEGRPRTAGFDTLRPHNLATHAPRS